MSIQMSGFSRFEDIDCWKRARVITQTVYQLSSQGDFSRDYSLKDQIRRSVVSIMSNIAEGYERDGNREFINFLSIAKGSCGEAISQLYVAADQNYISNEDFQNLYENLNQTGKMIGGLMNYLRASEIKGKKFR